jgi:hypothetical protein
MEGFFSDIHYCNVLLEHINELDRWEKAKSSQNDVVTLDHVLNQL